MRGFLTNGGQICTAHSRLIVHEDIKDALLTRLKKEIEELPFCGTDIALPSPSPPPSLQQGGGQLHLDSIPHLVVFTDSDDPIADRERGDNAWVNEKPTVLQPVRAPTAYQ